MSRKELEENKRKSKLTLSTPTVEEMPAPASILYYKDQILGQTYEQPEFIGELLSFHYDNLLAMKAPKSREIKTNYSYL